MADDNSTASGASAPNRTKSLPRVTRNTSSGQLEGNASANSGNVMMAPPSTRMQMPGRGGASGGPRGLGVRRSQSFKRTSKAVAAISNTSDHSSATAPTESGTNTMATTPNNTPASATLSPTRPMETSSVARPSPGTNMGETLSPGSSFNRGTTTAHNFVKNFLEEDDDVPMGGSGRQSAGNNTTTASGTNELTFDADAQRNVHRNLLTPNAADLLSTTPSGYAASASAMAAAAAQRKPEQQGLFKGRDDFYNVDQSVNLMDAEAGKYESKNKKNRRTSNSMVEIWLKDNPNAPGGTGSSAYNNGKDGKWHRMSTGEKIKDVAMRMIVPLTILVIVLLIVLFVVLQKGSGSSGSAPAPVPTTEAMDTPAPAPIAPGDMTAEMQSMAQILMDLQVATADDFSNAKAPTFQALSWMAKDEIALTSAANQNKLLRLRRLGDGHSHSQRTLQDEMGTERLMQRYVLAVLYYTWKPNEKADATNDQAAAAAAAATLTLTPPKDGMGASGAAGVGDNELWLSAVSECHWHGIGCHNEAQELATMGVLGTAGATQIRAMNLTAHDLSGTLPGALSALTNLVELDLRNNKLTGPLDAVDFAKWPQMEYLLLGSNKLTGTLPEGMSNLERIKDLDFSDNHFSGPLPALSGGSRKLVDLENVYWDRNRLTGSIPESMLKDMPNLEYLDVGDNKLAGSLPVALFELPQLRYIHVRNNTLTGSFPTNMASMAHLGTYFVILFFFVCIFSPNTLYSNIQLFCRLFLLPQKHCLSSTINLKEPFPT